MSKRHILAEVEGADHLANKGLQSLCEDSGPPMPNAQPSQTKSCCTSDLGCVLDRRQTDPVKHRQAQAQIAHTGSSNCCNCCVPIS